MTTETTTPEITTEERTSFLRTLPYVDELFGDERVACDGVRWSEVPLRALYSWGPGRRNPPTGVSPNFRCKLASRWRFTALEARPGQWDHTATSGNYCTSHLLTQLAHSDREQERVQRRWVTWRRRREQVRREVLPDAS